MTILEAYSILKSTKPARCERDRYHQRDELQHLLIPHLPVDERDKFERAMNRHFRLYKSPPQIGEDRSCGEFELSILILPQEEKICK